MSEFYWHKWLSLPAVVGEDPRNGKGACCFRMAQIVRTQLGLYWPSETCMEIWYKLAKEGNWDSLRYDWSYMTNECIPTPGSITMLETDPDTGAFGLGVLVDSYFMLTTSHNKQAIAVPEPAWKRANLKFYEVVG